MNSRFVYPLGLSLVALLASCTPIGSGGTPCASSAECGPGRRCLSGMCQPDSLTSQDGGSGSSDGGRQVLYTGCDPANPANPTLDTDCDGLSDAEEYNAVYGNGAKTEACNADTDGDGVRDGVEMGRTSSLNLRCGFVGDADPSGKTDPTLADSDGDGLKDGEEDHNQNGKVDPGESDPLRKDSDCDGLSDPEEVGGTLGCVTDPLKVDTDGDGLWDGLEQGLTAPGADPSQCTYVAAASFDADPSTKTDACKQDSDGDGIMDGAEDLNQNGRLDPGELNPRDNLDGQGPVQQACSTANLKPINFHKNGMADVQVALVPSFTEISTLLSGGGFETGGKEDGLIFFDPTHKVAGLAIALPPTGADAAAEETAARNKLHALGAVSGALTQTFTTWDKFQGSVRASYDQAGTGDLKTQINNLAKAFLGNSVTGLLTGTAGANGPFKVQAQYVRRTATRSVLVFAVTTAAAYTGGQIFRLDDVGGGSALAQFTDVAGTQCEVFTTQGNAHVDFLWVVDNSGSMLEYQTAVGNVGNLFAQKLSSAGLNWRVAGVSTDGASSSEFTTSISSSFFTDFGIFGLGFETALLQAKTKVQSLLPKAANDPLYLRTGADLHVILLGDADDQDSDAIPSYINFFQNYDGQGSKAVVHGIVCPEGQDCMEWNLTGQRRNLAVIAATGGVNGDINSAQPVGNPAIANTLDAILNAAIAGTGRQLSRPPISATIKVATEPQGTVGACNTSDIPRDRAHGFDFDSASRRIVFFGNCRPSGAGRKVAVSYRFWNDQSPDPGGDLCGNKCTKPLVCSPQQAKCVCPTDCGGCPSGQTCNPNTCSCSPGGIN